MLVGIGMRRIKVGSGEITNLPFLEELADFGLPMIVSTGMANMQEVDEAVEVIAGVRRRNFNAGLEGFLTLLQCTSNYPAAPQDANLRAMTSLKVRFGVPVGYSDHSEGTALAIGAAALGASVIEKHFTLDRTLPGPDHRASLAPDDFGRMVGEIRVVEAGLGDGLKVPRANELPVRELVRRSVTLIRARRAGEPIQAADLAVLRPGRGIPPKDLGKVAGKRAAHDLVAGRTLTWEDVVD